jgi:hypothetical protein
VLRIRFSRPIRPIHYAAQGPNLSANSPRNLQTTCNNGVLNSARNATLGFDCNTYSLGIRGDGGAGWNVRASFEAIVSAGSGPISATITNTVPDKFARVPAGDLTPLTAGKKTPKRASTGGNWQGDWKMVAKEEPPPRGNGVTFAPPDVLSMVQKGTVVCATWPWNPFPNGLLGKARGTVTGSTATLGYEDGPTRGTWSLTLAANRTRFSGPYTITVKATNQIIHGTLTGTKVDGSPKRIPANC